MTNKIGKKRKITFWTRLGFGMGGMLNSGALTFTHSYMVLFLSTECGLSAGEAALISSFAIYVNAILCPLMGFVADNFYMPPRLAASLVVVVSGSCWPSR